MRKVSGGELDTDYDITLCEYVNNIIDQAYNHLKNKMLSVYV